MHMGVLADEEFEVALHRLHALDLESDMVEADSRRVHAVIIRDLPRNDHQRHAPSER